MLVLKLVRTFVVHIFLTYDLKIAVTPFNTVVMAVIVKNDSLSRIILCLPVNLLLYIILLISSSTYRQSIAIMLR